MKKALIIAAILLAAGILISVGALAAAGFRTKNFGTVKFETNIYAVTERFDSIRINEHTANIVFVRSEDGTCSVVCHEPKKTSHTVAVEDGTLKIETKDQPDWTGFMDLSFEERKMTVSLPEDAYRALILDTRTGDVDVPEWLTFDRVEITASTADVCCRSSVTDSVVIKTGTGDIVLEGVSPSAIECSVTTGHIRMANVSCKGDVYAKVSTGKLTVNGLTCGNLQSEGSTGTVQLQNVAASGTMAIERSTGDVNFVNSDAAEIRVVTSTGDVTGTLRTAKIFTVKTSTGDVDVPASAAGGKCEIKTSTGDVRIGIASGK
jgi:Protein of unknown function (DUF2807).